MDGRACRGRRRPGTQTFPTPVHTGPWAVPPLSPVPCPLSHPCPLSSVSCPLSPVPRPLSPSLSHPVLCPLSPSSVPSPPSPSPVPCPHPLSPVPLSLLNSHCKILLPWVHRRMQDNFLQMLLCRRIPKQLERLHAVHSVTCHSVTCHSVTQSLSHSVTCQSLSHSVTCHSLIHSLAQSLVQLMK